MSILSISSLFWLAGLSSCAESIVVNAGHRAVAMTSRGEMRVIDEGVAGADDVAHVDDFDLRERVVSDSLAATTADGVRVGIGAPTVTYQFIPEEVVEADGDLGPHGDRPLVKALLAASVARVLAAYRWDALNSVHLREAQERVAQELAPALRRHHLALVSVDLKGASARAPLLAHAVTETSVWEQRALLEHSRVEAAKQRADRLREQAAGIAAANQHIAPTLTPAVLEEKSNRAWAALLASPSTATVVADLPQLSLEASP